MKKLLLLIYFINTNMFLFINKYLTKKVYLKNENSKNKWF